MSGRATFPSAGAVCTRKAVTTSIMIPGRRTTSRSNLVRLKRSNDKVGTRDSDVMEKTMSKGGKKHFGPGTQGKADGTGGLTDLPKDKIGENMVLSNRDKSQHTDQRGMDSKRIQSEQLQDHAASRFDDDTE